MKVATKNRASSNMRSLRQNDSFTDVVAGEQVIFTVLGWPEKIGADRVRIPVVRFGHRPSRRTYPANARVKLV